MSVSGRIRKVYKEDGILRLTKKRLYFITIYSRDVFAFFMQLGLEILNIRLTTSALRHHFKVVAAPHQYQE